MALKLRCTCGKIVTVPDNPTRRESTCPACGLVLATPGRGAPAPAKLGPVKVQWLIAAGVAAVLLVAMAVCASPLVKAIARYVRESNAVRTMVRPEDAPLLRLPPRGTEVATDPVTPAPPAVSGDASPELAKAIEIALQQAVFRHWKSEEELNRNFGLIDKADPDVALAEKTDLEVKYRFLTAATFRITYRRASMQPDGVAITEAAPVTDAFTVELLDALTLAGQTLPKGMRLARSAGAKWAINPP